MLLFKIFKKIAGIFGFKLIDKDLIKNDRELGKYSSFSIDNTLNNLFSDKKINFLIQIGSNDGKRFDTINEFIKKYSPISILVEPIKKDFEDLKNNYKDQKNIFFENSAISVNDSIKYLFKVNETKYELYDEHVKGISSFEINHLIKHGVSKSHIIKENINSITIKDLLNKYSLSELDLLIIDAEGYDGNIVIDFLYNISLRPIIIFEYIHINHKTFKKLIELLISKKYDFHKLDENVICFPAELENSKKYIN